MIGLLLIVAVCTVGLATCVGRLLRSYWREEQRANELRQQRARAERGLEEARRVHQSAPCRESRRLVVLAEACCGIVAAEQAGDWVRARTFEYQAEMMELLLTLPESEAAMRLMVPWNREQVKVASWN